MFLPSLTINSMTNDERLFIYVFSELSANTANPYTHSSAPNPLPFPCP